MCKNGKCKIKSTTEYNVQQGKGSEYHLNPLYKSSGLFMVCSYILTTDSVAAWCNSLLQLLALLMIQKKFCTNLGEN